MTEIQRYAVNLCDLDQLRGVDPLPLQILLADFLTAKPSLVNTDRRVWDAHGVILDGPAAQDPKRVQALIELLQRVIGPRKIKRRIRCYAEGPRGGWSEIRPNGRPPRAAPKQPEAPMATRTRVLPDYAKFVETALCPCNWNGENDQTCRALLHTIYRFPSNGKVPGRLQGFDYGATNGHVLHLWRREHHLPEVSQTQDAPEHILQGFAGLLPREGLEITLDRDAILAVMPKAGTVRARHMIAVRATYAGEAEWALIRPEAEKADQYTVPDGHEPLPPQFERGAMQTYHCLAAHYVRNALLGMRETVRMWLPMEVGRPVTLEGEGTRALIMPMRYPT